MKRVVLSAANLSYSALERYGLLSMADLSFSASESVFPALTCSAQASLRTGLKPAEHGLLANGFWCEPLNKPLFWEQNAGLVKGPRVWTERRQAGSTVGIFFFQQSMGEAADVILTPAPIHKHGGGMVMSCYSKPTDLAARVEKRLGKFPLWRYWGPLASPKVGRACLDWFEAMTELEDVDEAYLYLPTLDYAAQRNGPDSPQAIAALFEFKSQLERLVALCERRGASLSVAGDYAIAPVTLAPLAPNVLLRAQGFFKTRPVAGRAYPDFYQSTAFAMCDHELAFVYGPDRAKAAGALLATGDYERAEPLSPSCETLLAKTGSWCDYRWWTDNREAPDYATHVDIHNKPGFDPRELFFFVNRGTVAGTHGRVRPVAVA